MIDGKSVRGRQSGVSMWGLLFIFAVIAFFSLVAIKVVPIYLNQMKVASVMREVSHDPKLPPKASPASIRRILGRHWDIDDIYDLQPQDIVIRQGDNAETLSYDYEARTHLFYNVFVVIHFRGHATLHG